MIIIKTKKEIEILREGGKILGKILDSVIKKVKPGVTTDELDTYAYELIKKAGGKPAFLNYQPDGAPYPYPATICISVNDEIVHGIPSSRVLKEGDVVSLDLGLNYKGMFTDHARTVGVGKINLKSKKLLSVAEEALYIGIEKAIEGNTTGDIGHAIESFLKPYKYGIVRELAGHGVGRAIHEDPYIPNFGKVGKGEKLVAGMVVAIEPMVNEGGDAVIFEDDGYTVSTKDKKKSAHFEHTVLITDGEPEILTKI